MFKNIPVMWLSPLDNCDNCRSDFAGVMYDARMRCGIWGNICKGCFDADGCRLGIGLGQRYDLQDWNGKRAWIKTAG